MAIGSASQRDHGEQCMPDRATDRAATAAKTIAGALCDAQPGYLCHHRPPFGHILTTALVLLTCLVATLRLSSLLWPLPSAVEFRHDFTGLFLLIQFLFPCFFLLSMPPVVYLSIVFIW